MRPRKMKSHEPLHAQDLRRWIPERMTPRCVSLLIAALCFVQRSLAQCDYYRHVIFNNRAV